MRIDVVSRTSFSRMSDSASPALKKKKHSLNGLNCRCVMQNFPQAEVGAAAVVVGAGKARQGEGERQEKSHQFCPRSKTGGKREHLSCLPAFKRGLKTWEKSKQHHQPSKSKTQLGFT